MSLQFDKAIKDFVQAFKELDKNKTSPFDTQAEVRRIEGNIAWVHIPGGVDETPVTLTIDAKVGDSVQVRIGGGRGWILGNATNPPTDDTVANHAVNIVNKVRENVTVLNTIVVDSIQAARARFESIEVDTAKIHDLTADIIHASVGYIRDLVTGNVTAENIIADHAEIENLDTNYAHITNGVIDNAKIGHADVNGLNANYAQIDAANVTDLSAQNAWVNKIMVQTGLIAHEGAVFTLDAIQVNAANITAGTLDVNRLIVTVNGQKYLVNVDPTTGTPSYEKMDGNIVEPRTITADKIVAHDITVQEITTENLVGTNGWINLNQGKFFYTTNGSTWANTTNGIMWDGTNLKIKGDVNITAGNVYTKTQTDTALDGKVGNSEVITKINASSEGVQIQAAKVDIAGAAVFNNYSTTTQMNAAIGDAVDGIEVGGRNLYVIADSHEGYLVGSGTIGAMSSTRKEHYSEYIPVSEGETYMFQVWVTPVAASGEYLWMAYELYDSSKAYVGSRPAKTKGENTGTPQYDYYEITIPSGVAYLRVSARMYSDGLVKVEKGNKATDWSPAPEDVDSAINAVDTKADGANNQEQRIYYRSSSNSAPTAPSTWVTSTATANTTWSTKRMQYDSTYKYLWTCIQRKTVGGTITNSTVLLDDTTTVIDGGNIITNSIGANQIAANSIGAKHITISDSTNLVESNEIYESSLVTSGGDTNGNPAISNGYIVKKTATNPYLFGTYFASCSFKTDDEIYYEFVGRAATAGAVSFNLWGYSDTLIARNYTNITLTTSDAPYSGTIKLTDSNWTSAVKYIIGFSDSRDTKSQIYIKKWIVRRKNGGELIVDGSITSDHISANKISANKIKVDEINIAAAQITSGTIDNARIPNLSADKITSGTINIGRIPADALNSNINIGGRNLFIFPRAVSGYLTTNGNISSQDSIRRECVSDYISVSEGEVVIFQNWVTPTETNGQLWMAYQFFNSSKGSVGDRPTKYGTLGASTLQHDSFKITIPSGVSYIRVSARMYQDGRIKVEKGNTPTDWTASPEEVNNNLFEIYGSNAGYLASNGTIGGASANNKERYSGYIPVEKGDTIVFEMWVTPTPASSANYMWMAYEFYDSSKTYIGSRPSRTQGANTNTLQYYSWVIPIVGDSVKYIRVSGRFYDDGKIVVSKENKTYITAIDNDGIRIHPSSTENNSVLIDGTSMRIYKGGTTDAYCVAEYGSTVRIGKPTSQNTGNVYIDDDSVDIRKGSTVLSTFTASGAELGKNSNTAIINMCNSAFKIVGQYEQFISANDTFTVNIKNNASSSYRKVEIGAGDESCITFFEQPSASDKSPITNIHAGSGLLGRSVFISLAPSPYLENSPEIILDSEQCIELYSPRVQFTQSTYSTCGAIYYTYSAPKTGSQTYNAVWTSDNGDYRLGRPSSSSRRYKEDIKPVENDELDPHRLYDIPVMQFKYKEGYFPQEDEYENNRTDVVGFIAEDVLEHYPQAAIVIDEEVDNWNERYIIPPMLKLIQEQNDRIAELERRLS